MVLSTALPQMFLKFTFFDSLTFREKSGMLQCGGSSLILVSERRGREGGERAWGLGQPVARTAWGGRQATGGIMRSLRVSHDVSERERGRERRGSRAEAGRGRVGELGRAGIMSCGEGKGSGGGEGELGWAGWKREGERGLGWAKNKKRKRDKVRRKRKCKQDHLEIKQNKFI